MTSITRPEAFLWGAVLAALALACTGPFVAQHDHYHAFADQRSVWGLSCAMDVLSNLPFAIAGLWGLVVIAMRRQGVWDARWALAAVFFAGLCLTAVGSTTYHLAPDNWGLAWDRMGMVSAFAGLMGIAVADRVSVRSAAWMAALVLVTGPMAVAVWYTTGDLGPWSVVQGGGMLLVLVLATQKPVPGAWNIPLAAIIAVYALAKLLELGDHTVFAWTGGQISGHSLKHIVAAWAALPVLFVMHNGARVRKPALSLA
ncbi:MAG: hypothetical protein CFE44_08350 [Burkholderiales bacterium PBB4]|nr:MAG: hypothetical protein CFE44_08350 [Burkholderiales bacterium PBB4]